MRAVTANAIIFCLVAGGTAACSSRRPYIYEPTENKAASTEASYQIPSRGEERGEVRVITQGVVDLRNKKDLPDIRALRMQMLITNTSDEQSWTMDTREQKLILPGEGTSRAAYINTERGEEDLPYLTITPGHRKIVDFYFPLPQGMKDAGEIPGFQFSWRLTTGKRVVTEMTAFDRVEMRPPLAFVYPHSPYAYTYPHGLGWGPIWWWDRDYAHWTWRRPVPVYPLT